MFGGYNYIEWRNSRINGLKKYISPEYFNSKTLLELGCGYADIGNLFRDLNSTVTCADARQEHLDIVKNKYPYLKTLLIDCDNEIINDKYDIILHWGLLSHLQNIEQHLENVSNKCDVLFLDTEIFDSEDSDFFVCNENGYDQAFNKIGFHPSQSYVEKLLEKNGFNFKLIKDPILNSREFCYDWESGCSNFIGPNLRRFWICWKNTECPLNREPSIICKKKSNTNDSIFDNLTILLQGVIKSHHCDLLKTVIEYKKYCKKIVISTYRSPDNEMILKTLSEIDGIIIVENDLLEMTNEYNNKFNHPHVHMRNCFYQLNTIFNGLKHVDTEWVLKTRTDTVFSDMDKFILNMQKNYSKITCTSIYVRGVHAIKFHPADILFGGTTKTMNKVIDLSIKNYYNIDGGLLTHPGYFYFPEVIIFKPYIESVINGSGISLETVLGNNELYLFYMETLFDVFPINKHSNYLLSHGERYFDEPLYTTREYFIHGCRA